MHGITAENDDAVVRRIDLRVLNEDLGQLEVGLGDQDPGLGRL